MTLELDPRTERMLQILKDFRFSVRRPEFDLLLDNGTTLTVETDDMFAVGPQGADDPVCILTIPRRGVWYIAIGSISAIHVKDYATPSTTDRKNPFA